MKELIIRITFDDEGCYKGCGDNTNELIISGISQYLKIDLQDDGIIKEGWHIDVIDKNDN